MKVKVRRATWDDEDQVLTILETFNLDRGFDVNEFFVAEYQGRVVGCARLRQIGDQLELCSVGIEKSYQRVGVGSEIVESILNEVDHRKVYCLTPHPDYFTKFGFKEIKNDELPDELKEKAKWCEEHKHDNWVSMAR